MSMSFISQNRPVVLRGIRSGVGQYNNHDFHALSLQGLREDTVREIDGWLWNTEILVLVEKEEELNSVQQGELTRLL